MPGQNLLQRIEWILKTREWSQRELSRRAGLAEAHVGTITHRLRTRPGADIERETLAALARGAGVSVDWLADGKGAPDAATAVITHPHLAAAIERLRRDGRASERACAAALAIGAESPVDLDEETWALMLLDLERSFKKKP